MSDSGGLISPVVYDHHQALVEAASWTLVSELWRRYPERFRLALTHPCSGQYDCLSLYDRELRHVADINRKGRVHVFRSFGRGETPEPLGIWPRMLGAAPSDEMPLDSVCHLLGLEVPAKLPPTTPDAVVYRLIAALLRQALFGRAAWSCEQGLFDSSEYVGRVKHFRHFPAAEDRLSQRLPSDLKGEAACRFWFVCVAGEPQLCFEDTGFAWDRRGGTFDLMATYSNNGRSLSRLLVDVAADLLR